MSSSSSTQIEITHIINAHRFWFKYINKPDPNVTIIESALDKYVLENSEDVYADRSNGKYRHESIVAVYLVSKKKWVRAEVDATGEPAEEDEIIVWATDYGMPVKSKLDLVVLLNNELKKTCYQTPSSIVQGGIINIMPASCIINPMNNENRLLEGNKWDSKVIETLEKMKLYSQVTLHFEKKFETNDHVFGELKIVKDDNEKYVSFILQNAMRVATEVSLVKFKRNISASETIKGDRWLDNNGELNCIENEKTQSIVQQATSLSSYSSNSRNTSPRAVDSSKITAAIKSTTIKEDKSESIEIDQLKILQKFSRLQLMSTVEKAQTTTKAPETPPALNSAQSVQKMKPRSSKYQSTVSVQSKQSEQSLQSKQSTQPTQSHSSFITQSLPLAQIEHSSLFNKIKSVPVFVRNNMEEPIESINSAQFTSAVHRGMKMKHLQETYVIQGYAWPNLLRGNSMVLVDSQSRGKTMAYLPALCSMVQREMENTEAEKGERNKRQAKMGTLAIIICLTSSVKQIADECRAILQMPTFKSGVVEAIGTLDAVSLTIKLYNGCNILVSTAPCLMDLIENMPPHVSEKMFGRLKSIAFENLDCIMEKQPDAINYIFKNLCSRKSYKGDLRQFIVTSRTWQSTFFKFLNEKDITDSVLIIGNHLEAAFCNGVLLHFRLCKNEVKLDILTEHIQMISYRTERTMIVCTDSSEASQIAKHFESKKIPHELTKEIESNYAQSKIKSFWDKINGILICTDVHLPGLEIKNVQHILHFSVPIQEFRPFLTRHSTLLDFYSEGNNKEKATSTVFLDDNNFRQLPKLVDLLTRDGQQVPQKVLELSQNARMLNIRERAEKRRFESICNFIFMHGASEHQANCRHRHLLLPTDVLDDTELLLNGQLRFNVLQIISPTEYVIRPTAHRTGEKEKWQTINNSNEFDDLNTQMQAYYKDADNQKALHTLELGQKCVVQLHEIFYRAEIIQIYEKRKIIDFDTYEVRFVDTGDVEQRHAFELFTLDEPFRAIPNQAYHLHLTSVAPADKEDDWDPRVCDKVRTYLTGLNKNEDNLIYEANILFSLRNTIVVDIMRLIGLKRAIVHCWISTYLRNRKYGIKSSNSKVIEMAKAVGVKIKEKLPKKSANKANSTSEVASSKSSVKSEVKNQNGTTSDGYESNTDLISFNDMTSESTSQDECKEKWACPWKAQHKYIQISLFHSPKNFFVVEKSEKLNQLYNAINDYIETSLNDSMECPDVYKYCLVRTDDVFNRAKVIEVFYGEDIQLKVFLVDTGLSTTVDISDVYDIPDNFIQMLPFQAIWCNLVGIKPIGNDENCESEWTEEQIDEIYNAIDQYGDELVLHTALTDKHIESKIADTKFVRHNIVLLALPDQEQQIDINKMIVAQQLAEFDPETQNLLEKVPILVGNDNDSDSESDWDDECNPNQQQNKWIINNPPKEIKSPKGDSNIETDFDQINALLQDNSFMLDADEFLRDLCNAQRGENNQPAIEPRDSGNSSANEGSEHSIQDHLESISEDSGNPTDRHHQLEYIHKRPCVFWWQTDEMVVLKISAHDDVKYGLEITSDQLIYDTVQNDEKIVAVIHLFGCVEYELTSHEVRGVNVVVRLTKSCPIMWPRLLYTAQKCNWVIQNIDAIKYEHYYDEVMYQLEKAQQEDESDEESDDDLMPAAVKWDLEDDERSFDEQSEGASF